MILRELHPQAVRIAEALKARGEKIAVADGATGGLIGASLLTVPGALKFYVGGGIVYSFKARDVLFDLPREAYEGMRSATEEYALLQARAIRDRLGAEWGIAESGAAGSSKHPMGVASGKSVAAVAGPQLERTQTIETSSDDRIDNMAAFTRNALNLLESALSE
ncbi:CinA family protein [Erythrobacter sp. F6033]|uniref:CinA family protein n=1 Tax=Erythrobacter sp. F6033 TaxID=2926401 RepID=UPI001FF52E11|nr:CinA family protein [Erythrobacter sp. F6033]MCK0128182.1 CinA family protein [Erythrobacter sp. F6033]